MRNTVFFSKKQNNIHVHVTTRALPTCGGNTVYMEIFAGKTFTKPSYMYLCIAETFGGIHFASAIKVTIPSMQSQNNSDKIVHSIALMLPCGL